MPVLGAEEVSVNQFIIHFTILGLFTVNKGKHSMLLYKCIKFSAFEMELSHDPPPPPE